MTTDAMDATDATCAVCLGRREGGVLVLVVHPDGPAAQLLMELAAPPTVHDVYLFISDTTPAPAAPPAAATNADESQGYDVAALEATTADAAMAAATIQMATGTGRLWLGPLCVPVMAFLIVLIASTGLFGAIWLSCWLATKNGAIGSGKLEVGV